LKIWWLRVSDASFISLGVFYGKKTGLTGDLATGIKVERPRTWRARLADLLPPLRRRLASPDDDVPDLPEVDPSRVPKSFEPGRKTKAKPKAKRKAKRAVKPAVKPPAPAPVVVPVEHQVAPDPTRDVPRPSIEDQGDVQMGGV
jgi:hypothetical protein